MPTRRPAQSPPHPHSEISSTEPQTVWLLRWEVSRSRVSRQVRRLGGTLLERRTDRAWRILLPQKQSWLAAEIAADAQLEQEVLAERVRRPFRARSLAPELSGALSREVWVKDSVTGAPISGATVILEGQSGLSYRAVTDARGRADLSVLEADFVRLECLPRDAYWPQRFGPQHFGPQGFDAGLSADGGPPLELGLDPLGPLEARYGWGFTKAMKIDRVHQSGITGKGVRVAVLDTGVSPHPDLKIAGGVNTADLEPDSQWQDTHWHGTHVAGILCARGTADALVGVAPDAELHAVRVGKVLGSEATGFSNQLFETDLLEGITWCLEHDIEVLNLSIFSRQTRALDELIEYAYRQGVILVAPSGNRRAVQDSSGVDYPARHPRVISVGAVGRLDTYPDNSYFASAEDGALFSPRFPHYFVPGFSKGGQGLDFVAPGVAILSTVPTGLQGWDVDNRRLFGYTSWMGTSQASPFIAGLIALVLESHPTLRAYRDSRRVDGVREVLMRGSVSLELDPHIQGFGLPMAPACVGPGFELS